MSTPKIVFLVGIKHSGKSALGRFASQTIPNATFYDSDDLILERLTPPNTTLRQYYREAGQAAFMEKEYRAVKELIEQLKGGLVIISLGGGACDNGPLISLMQSVGQIIYLQVDAAPLYKRILKGGIPFLNRDDLRPHSCPLQQRDAQYRKLSDYVLQYRLSVSQGRMGR